MAHEKADAGIPPDGPFARPAHQDAWRIAQLEREIRELRRTNEALWAYMAGELARAPRLPAPDGTLTQPAPGHLTPHGNTPRAAAAAPGRAEDARMTTRPSPRPPARPRPLVEFRALGPIEAVVGDRLVDLGAPKQRALLALLVSKVGKPVAVDLIVEELWTGHPPPSAIPSLQAYVANLRRVLEPDREPRTAPTVLRTYGRGYLLDSRVVEVDVQRFSERAVAGWQALDADDPRFAVHEFEVALAQWRGPAYAEVADAAGVRPDVARLEELRLSVVEGRCAALLAVGAHEIAVAELEAFVQDHPLREYGCELLSLALYRAGRQADALALLRTNQRRLADELGIDPRPALQVLEQLILNQSPSLDWPPPQGPAVTSPWRPPAVPNPRGQHRSGRRPLPHHAALPGGEFLRSPLPAEL
ncbi:BTAD domain-containing putative transcriptional regulator [Streptomyces sp. NPDC048253]|uniref:AfsR/SARP family transcriptional regulator n=1 Tax=unclassified Streptomyces TaxID=2593676 RepID=UPI0006CD6758|nr:transcriptional regulator, SARP family [Actinobacteria bacterium OV320]